MKPTMTYVMGDMHFGHKNIAKFRTQFESMEHHEEVISDNWQDTVRSYRDKVYVLGDAAFTQDGLQKIAKLRGRKFLVRGNHDTLSTYEYSLVFEEIYGILKYKRPKHIRAWLTHAPIHPAELRGAINIHGHVHSQTIMTAHWAATSPDERYVNACPENLGYAPTLLHPLIPKREKYA